MRKKFLLLVLIVFGALPVFADEGMWLPSLISQRIKDMQAKGFKLSAEDIYSINQSSLKDAIVHFGGGCTGELISDEGLLITNHHCGFGQIQSHSSVEHDYLKDGFWAMKRSEELPNPGLTVSFLEYMEDVTDRVLKGYRHEMTEQQRTELVRKNTEEIVNKATGGNENLRASVSPLYYGNQYYLFVYKVFRDVRLVGAHLLPSGNSAAIPITGCGPVIRETSVCSAYMPIKTTSLPPIRKTMFRTSLKGFSISPPKALKKGTLPWCTDSRAVRTNI